MKNKTGISLIVLVITIIVIIILAGSVILSLSNNSPILQSKQAKFKTNVGEYNSELTLNISKEYLLNNSFDQTTFNAAIWDGGSVGETIKKYITIITKEDGKKFIIQNSKLVYVGLDETEKVWLAELNIPTAVAIPAGTETLLYCQAKSGVLYDDYGWKETMPLGNMDFYLGGDGHGIFRTYLSFDTTTISGSIASAKIRIKVVTFWDGTSLNIATYTGTQPLWGDNFRISQTESDWGCGTVTLGTQTANTVNKWYEWNVPIQYVNKGGETQFEVRGLSDFDSVTVGFNGVNSVNKPELIITY